MAFKKYVKHLLELWEVPHIKIASESRHDSGAREINDNRNPPQGCLYWFLIT